MPDTYCSDLWHGITINKRGEVFSCCLQMPVMIGNIYEQPLSKMINSPELLEYRKESLTGHLVCYKGCNFVNKSNSREQDLRNMEVDYSELRRLHISFGEACNIRCIMCQHPIRHSSEEVFLDGSILIENVDISPFQEILIQGGEPLYIRSCLKYMEYLGSLDKRYILLTNGLLMNSHLASIIVRDASVVSISINAATKQVHELVNSGSNWERVIENISTLLSMREKIGTDMVLNGRMTLVPQNLHEIPIFLESYRDIGFDTVNFGFDKVTVPDYLSTKPRFKEELALEIRDALDKVDITDVDSRRLVQLGLVVN